MDFGESVLHCVNEDNTGDGRIFEPMIETIPIENMINDRSQKGMKSWNTVNFGSRICFFIDKDFFERRGKYWFLI